MHTQTMIHHGQNNVMMQCRQWFGLLSFTSTITFSPIVIAVSDGWQIQYDQQVPTESNRVLEITRRLLQDD